MLERLRANWTIPFWTIIRVWLGYEWVTAGFGKITGGFDATGFLTGAIEKATGDHPAVAGWYAAFLKGFAMPNVELFNVLVPYGELLVGLGLLFGTLTTIALYAGAFMNLNFLLAGTVSTNPVLYTMAILLLVAGPAAYAWGVDRYMAPRLKHYLAETFNRGERLNH
ncbi:DoxX family membrane protein [Ammoniphilus resinae]|uniref:Thiosulfate dehydrogenase [quinone] large subunit n=1 Tax=Ammoniphilus resinae TaxID=861532 RepID=A0ABS4GRS9_9BACL|nr:DoxX family membrane protein [Ammoniphilus resinae]MBP1932987.1 thiosulfate dehydrogenase [quinone] large subunit [Ammoniphilus resinae]